jgi:hypothetical protein
MVLFEDEVKKNLNSSKKKGLLFVAFSPTQSMLPYNPFLKQGFENFSV